ncbi:MAG: hypothetical protein K9G46_13860 [Flavobacteriales bacterium]|nr:hypothetical protein [Flavobacteriales bacterium]
MTQISLIKAVRIISRNSSLFKIGKTGQTLDSRLTQHPKFSRIAGLTWSRDHVKIEFLESFLNGYFIRNPKNDNTNAGSAGIMTMSGKYWLYVVYNPIIPKKKKKLTAKPKVRK